MFNEIVHATYKKTAQTIVYLSHFISCLIIAGIVITAFSPTAGIVNTILGWFGTDSFYFLTRPEWFSPDLYRHGHLARGRVRIHHLSGRHRRCQSVALRECRGGWGQPVADDFAIVQTATGFSAETVTAAIIVCSIIPILIVYPFIQKYFEKGILLGGLKDRKNRKWEEKQCVN
jgi:hypothetical protein